MQIISAVAIGKTASTAVTHITDPIRPHGARCDSTLPKRHLRLLRYVHW